MAAITIAEGLGYIIGHFKGQRQCFPRTISTKATQGAQVLVNDPGEAMDKFVEANFMDCRISAYPPKSTLSSYVGVNLDMAPSIIMIDLDRETFKSQIVFERALAGTINRINSILPNCCPTVIWSGSGYHIYIVLDAFELELVDLFNNDRFGSTPSQKFLRYAESFLSYGNCDSQHNKTLSLKNCMLRIPGSINSKNGQHVRILQFWNKSRPNIRYLLEDFYIHLCDQRIQELREKDFVTKIPSQKIRYAQSFNGNGIEWIEVLLRTPITDYRKFVIWRILAPYLLNIKGLSRWEASNIIREWLDECGRLQSLDFNPSYRIKGALNSTRNFLPIACNKLKVENKGFYRLLQDNGVLTK
jgi:Primase X